MDRRWWLVDRWESWYLEGRSIPKVVESWTHRPKISMLLIEDLPVVPIVGSTMMVLSMITVIVTHLSISYLIW